MFLILAMACASQVPPGTITQDWYMWSVPPAPAAKIIELPGSGFNAKVIRWERDTKRVYVRKENGDIVYVQYYNSDQVISQLDPGDLIRVDQSRRVIKVISKEAPPLLELPADNRLRHLPQPGSENVPVPPRPAKGGGKERPRDRTRCLVCDARSV